MNFEYILEESTGPIDTDMILNALPHREPFLMIDRVLEIKAGRDESGALRKEGTTVRGIKSIAYNEPHFAGHFPGNPIMPGVLTIEALAQASAFAFYLEMEHAKKLNPNAIAEVFLLGVDKARFKRMVKPGDCLILESKLNKIKQQMITYSCKATVEGKLVSKCDLISSLVIKR